MDLALDDDQQAMVQAAADFLAEACDAAAMRAAADSADGMDRALWRGIVEQGWCAVAAPEAEDGLGLGHAGLVLLQEQLGRHLAGVPFFESVIVAGTLLRGLGNPEPALLAGVMEGAVLVPAMRAADARAAVTAVGDWRIDGTWPQVPGAAWADNFLLLVDGATPRLFWLPATELDVQPLETVDLTRRSACLRARDVHVPAAALLAQGEALRAALATARDLGAIALAAEQVGVAQQCLDLTLAYAAQRVQFDRPIAGFQAVKHRCAQMLVAIESARSAVYGAAAVADAAPDAATLAFHAAEAWCAAGDAARYASQEAIQLHGGVGYTWELDVQRYFKRAQANRARLGAPATWRERVAAQLLDELP